MKEEFLHYLWRTHKWINSNLRTTDNRNLEIIYPGDYNEDQGPDFSYAKLSIDGTVWIGQVEMHLRSSDWNRHNHSIDAHYHNVILHVVWIHDEEIIVNNNVLPTLELRNYITNQDVSRYMQLIECEDRIPCEKLFANVPRHLIILQMENASVHRLQQKTLKLKKERQLGQKLGVSWRW